MSVVSLLRNNFISKVNIYANEMIENSVDLPEMTREKNRKIINLILNERNEKKCFFFSFMFYNCWLVYFIDL